MMCHLHFPPVSNAHSTLVCRELDFQINSALQRLTPRECVIFEGLSRPEMSAISVIVSSSEEAVKTSFFRATRKMCAALVDSAMNSNFETETDSGQICRNLNTKKGMDTCKYIFSRFQLWNLREQRRRFD